MTKDRFAALAKLQQPAEQPAEKPKKERAARPAPAQPAPAQAAPVQPAAAPPVSRTPADLKALGGRIPLEVFQEFSQHKLDAERAVRLRRVTTEVGLEALVRLLRDPATLEAWHRELVVVVEEQG